VFDTVINIDLLRPYSADALKSAKPIYAITSQQAQFDQKDPLQNPPPDTLVNLALTNNFRGKAGEVLANEDAVLIGMGQGTDPFLYAAGTEKLPDGTYYITNFPDDHDYMSAACLGWLMGSYQFNKYKDQSLKTARLIAPQSINHGDILNIARATGWVRDLVNTPTNDLLPSALEKEASDFAQIYNASIKVLKGGDLLTENFPMIHAVGRASCDAPRLIDIRWSPKGSSNASSLPKVTLVGKGVCFDSGGLNIKGGAGMALMKKDMGGAAHALGLASMIMQANLPINLRVLLPTVENAISDNAFRPSDVLTSRKGLSIEIGNTDAEGRLILADALAYAQEDDPDILISLATLTGAARVAMGPEVIPFYTDDESLANQLMHNSKSTFDPVWQLPLWTPYSSMLSSPVADLNNISNNNFAGSIIAALFLKNFVAPQTRWMHFDIYAWRPKSAPGRPSGGEAQTIRALYGLFKEQFGNN